MGVNRDHNEESMPFLSVNQQLMKTAGNSWIEPDNHSVQYVSHESAMSMFVNHFHLNPDDYTWRGKPRGFLIKLRNYIPWGFKDPRNTFTAEAWLKLFPKAKVIHVVRHPAAVADSLMRRNEVDGEVHDIRLSNFDFNLKLWKKYVEQANKVVSSLPKHRTMTVRYEDLLQGGTHLTDLGRFVGRDLVTSFAERIHPDKAARTPEANLKEVEELMKAHGYSS